MQDLSALEGKTLAELREIGKVLGLANVMVKKRDLIEMIAAATRSDEGESPAPETSTPPSEIRPIAEPSDEQPAKRGRRPRLAKVEAAAPQSAAVAAPRPTASNAASPATPRVPIPSLRPQRLNKSPNAAAANPNSVPKP